MQKGHILSVLQVTPELNAGGVERTTLEMAEAISRAGGLALVVSAGGRLEPDLKATGGELIKLPVDSKNPFTVALNAQRIAAIVKKRGVQIIHARSRAPAWSALLAARMTHTPFVTTFHGIYNGRRGPKRFYNSVMTRGDVVIANSEFTKEHMLENYDVDPAQVVVIPRGADIELFDRAQIKPADIAAMRMSWNLAPDDARCVVIAPARLTRWKGQLLLIEAARLIEERRPGALKIIFAGDAQGRTSYLQEIETAIATAGLQETVAVVGHVDKMPVAFAASDIAAFPVIEAEAFGRGAIEAQAMGVPVIASNIGGFTETIVEGETGFLVPPNVPVALASVLERLIDLGPQARATMGRLGEDRARTRYSKAALQSATLAVYQRVLREAEQRKLAKAQRGLAL